MVVAFVRYDFQRRPSVNNNSAGRTALVPVDGLVQILTAVTRAHISTRPLLMPPSAACSIETVGYGAECPLAEPESSQGIPPNESSQIESFLSLSGKGNLDREISTHDPGAGRVGSGDPNLVQRIPNTSYRIYCICQSIAL